MTPLTIEPPGKPPMRYHGRVVGLMLLVFVLPATVVSYVAEQRISIWTFVPGVGGAVLILGWMYFKWWREGRLG
jgi:hypothetical protein